MTVWKHGMTLRPSSGEVMRHYWNNTSKYPIYDINLVQTLQLSSESRPPSRN
jgi:hypothetical protein